MPAEIITRTCDGPAIWVWALRRLPVKSAGAACVALATAASTSALVISADTDNDVRFALAKQYDMPHFTPAIEGPSRELVAAFEPVPDEEVAASSA